MGLEHLSGLAQVVLLSALASGALADPLPAYNIDSRQVSVSGISSGGYMAAQFATAHSAGVMGVGVIAGGPYRCAANGINQATTVCMQGHPDPLRSAAETESALLAGLIDHPGFMARQRVWLFSGYNDGVVKQPVMNALYEFYRRYVPATQIFYQDALGAGHAMITTDQGEVCDATGGDFINDCDYDAAGLMLQHIYGGLVPPTLGSLAGEFVPFDQQEFVEGDMAHSGLAKTGYLYVPTACARGGLCRVHVVFHGCRQFAEMVGERFFRNAGYNRWADENHILVLYPQTKASRLAPFNPKGCWDWWGYTGPNFTHREGIQISAVRRMLERLAGGPASELTAETPAATDVRSRILAADSSDDSAALSWTPARTAAGFRLYRSDHRSDHLGEAFREIAVLPPDRLSYVDHGLSPDTNYVYRLEVTEETSETRRWPDQTVRTRPRAPYCDPFFNDNVTHVARDRAFVWFGLVFARGSWDYMGLWNILTETALYRDNDGFRAGTCP